MPVCLERTATTFLEALHESEGRRSCLKHCQLRRAAIERSLMEQAETLVTTIRSLSDSPDKLTRLNAQLGTSDDLLKRSLAVLPDVLSTLDPAAFTLGWLFILDKVGEEAANAAIGHETFLTLATLFIDRCTPQQLHVNPDKFASIGRWLVASCIQLGEPARATAPLLKAVRKVQPSAAYLTPQHVSFLQVCVLAKLYQQATNLLADDVCEADPGQTGITAKDFLLYCFYGGSVHVGLKNWPKAREFFLHAITAPAACLSAITVAAYKRLTLVSLIHQGNVQPFPKYTSTVVQRYVKQPCAAYTELAKAYATHSHEEVAACVAKHEAEYVHGTTPSREEERPKKSPAKERTAVEKEVAPRMLSCDHLRYVNDTNLGLVKQCVQSLYKRNIQRLTQTYLTLSLEDIATSVALPSARDAELRILRMIGAGEIHATINQKDGMVRFLEDPEQYNSGAMLQRLDAEVQNMTVLARKVAAVDEAVSTSRQYLTKIAMKERHGRFPDPDEVYDLGGGASERPL